MTIEDKIAKRVKSLKLPASVVIAERARQMQADGLEVINLSCGEPNFNTPTLIKEAVTKAVADDFTRYTNSRGIIDLRKAIGKKLKLENGVDYNPDNEILVTPGAKQAIFYALYPLLELGDEVLILEPGWLSYADIVRLSGAVPVSVPTTEKNNFRPSYEDIASKISGKTKAIIINSPNNPTGMVLDKDDLKLIAKVAKEFDLIVIADEIYEKIIFDRRQHFSLASFPGMKERTIAVNGFSKTFAMTGWRIGYLATSSQLMNYILKVHQHIATCAASFVQQSAVGAFEGVQEDVKQMVKQYEARRDLVYNNINSINKLSCLKTEGTFYSFVNIKELDMKSEQAAEFILAKARVAMVPGVAYGGAGEGYLRISFATTTEELMRSFARIKEVLG